MLYLPPIDLTGLTTGWIGIKAIGANNDYYKYQSDGTDIVSSVENFFGGIPNPIHECAKITQELHGYLSSVDCNQEYIYVCQRIEGNDCRPNTTMVLFMCFMLTDPLTYSYYVHSKIFY